MLFTLLGIFGLVFGSFASMASYRLVSGESFLGRSKCVTCSHKLSARNLFPLFSWLKQGGKCEYCKTSISKRYPMTELLTAIMFCLIGFYTNDLWMTILLMLIATSLVVMIIIDFEHMIIPDELQVIMAGLGVVFAYYQHYLDEDSYGLIHMIFMPLTGFLIAYILRKGFAVIYKKDALGFGDVKFFAVAGIYLEFSQFSAFLFFSGIIGIGIAIVWRSLKRGPEFPFGPALAISMYICMLFPQIEQFTIFN